MKSKITGILMVAVMFVSVTAMGQRQNKLYGKTDGKEMMKKRDRKGDGERTAFFTDEQREAMKTIRLETAKQVNPFKNELHELMARQQTLVTADKADLNAINKNIEKISGVKAEMAKIMAKQHQEFRSQLTEEQRIKFDSRKKGNHNQRGNSFPRNRMERTNTRGFGG